jgi:hypothetical protein
MTTKGTKMSKLKALKEQLEEIKRKKSDLFDDEEVLSKQIEASTIAELLTVLPGTSWSISRDGDCLDYDNDEPGKGDTVLEKKIFDEYGLYPHGSRHITENLIVGCSDHSIYIRTLLCSKTAKKNFHQEDFNRVSAKVLIDFAKENKMKISCYAAERAIQSAKETVEFLEKQLTMVKELIKG